jgi:hypothetical protein
MAIMFSLVRKDIFCREKFLQRLRVGRDDGRLQTIHPAGRDSFLHIGGPRFEWASRPPGPAGEVFPLILL